MIGIQNSILVLDSSNEYKIHETLKGTKPQRIAFDPLDPDRAYCGTLAKSLWKTNDRGLTWSNIGNDGISSPYVASAVRGLWRIMPTSKYNDHKNMG